MGTDNYLQDWTEQFAGSIYSLGGDTVIYIAKDLDRQTGS